MAALCTRWPPERSVGSVSRRRCRYDASQSLVWDNASPSVSVPSKTTIGLSPADSRQKSIGLCSNLTIWDFHLANRSHECHVRKSYPKHLHVKEMSVVSVSRSTSTSCCGSGPKPELSVLQRGKLPAEAVLQLPDASKGSHQYAATVQGL